MPAGVRVAATIACAGRQAGGDHVLELDVLGPPEQPARARAADIGAERDAARRRR